MDKREPKYSINEKVEIHGWCSSATGVVKAIKWIYHNRLEEYTWGYSIDYDDGKDAGFSLVYIPEGYLNKLGEKRIVRISGQLDEITNKYKTRYEYSDGSIELVDNVLV